MTTTAGNIATAAALKPPEKEKKKTMDEILEIIEKARNLPMDHEPDVSDLWDILNTIEKIAKDEVKQ